MKTKVMHEYDYYWNNEWIESFIGQKPLKDAQIKALNKYILDKFGAESPSTDGIEPRIEFKYSKIPYTQGCLDEISNSCNSVTDG